MNSGFLSPKKIRVLSGERYLSAEPRSKVVLISAGATQSTRPASVVHVISEQVLLNVGHTEEDHAEEVHADPNDGIDVVLGDVAIGLTPLLGQESHEADGVEATEEAPVT